MDLQSMLSQVIQWHRDSQYEPIVQLLEILIESSNGLVKDLEQTTVATKELAIQHTKASLYTYFGDSLFKLKYHRRALRAYEQALSYNDSGIRRASKRYKTNGSLNNSCDISKINSNTISTNENELKYRMHCCYLKLNDKKEAVAVLERIPALERSSKISLALADIYSTEKNDELAKEAYFEVLKQEPLRLDLVIKICKLGGYEVKTILDVIPDEITKSCPWYPSWVQAQCYLHSPNSKQAVKNFEALTSHFEKRAPILTGLAEAHYHDGNFREAVRIYQIAYSSDPLSLMGVDSYAACLHKESNKRALEDLAVTMCFKCHTEGEFHYEPWLALAHYYASIDKKEPKALLFSQKAYKLNQNSVETLILLACLFLEKKDTIKATAYIHSAHKIAPYRYEVQRILCDSYLADSKKSGALNYAKAGVKSLGETARSYYLYADIMLKSQDQRRKNSARTCLDKAIKLDPTYLPAVFAFADSLIEEKKFDHAIHVLENALPNHSMNNELHKYLYTCYNEKKDNDRALYHQNLASDHSTSQKTDHESLHRNSQENAITQDDVETILGLEADELVDHGDSEIDELLADGER